jgi:hypothetical protein
LVSNSVFKIPSLGTTSDIPLYYFVSLFIYFIISPLYKFLGFTERPRGARSGAPHAHGEGPRLSTELLDRGALPSCGLPFA